MLLVEADLSAAVESGYTHIHIYIYGKRNNGLGL